MVIETQSRTSEIRRAPKQKEKQRDGRYCNDCKMRLEENERNTLKTRICTVARSDESYNIINIVYPIISRRRSGLQHSTLNERRMTRQFFYSLRSYGTIYDLRAAHTHKNTLGTPFWAYWCAAAAVVTTAVGAGARRGLRRHRVEGKTTPEARPARDRPSTNRRAPPYRLPCLPRPPTTSRAPPSAARRSRRFFSASMNCDV